MNKHRTSTFRYHSSLLPSSVPGTAVISSDCSQQTDNLNRQEIIINDQQHIYKTCHCHSSTDENQHRNNHNNDLIQYDEISKPITHRKRRTTISHNQNEYYHQSNEKSSLLPIYINNILLILIRLMILFIVVLIISFTFYYSIVYIYSKPKKSGWERIINWLSEE